MHWCFQSLSSEPSKFYNDAPEFPGSKHKLAFTEKLQFIEPERYDGIPVYRVMDRQGNIIDESQDPKVTFIVFHILGVHV